MEPKAPSPVDIHVGERIRRLRVERGLSQPDLAERLGVRYQQFQKYESGANRISAGRLFELAQILGVGLPWFYVGLGASGVSPLAHAPRTGLAEDAAPYLTEADIKEERARLVGAYESIAAADVRRAVLDVVETAAAISGESPDAGRRED